MSIIKGILPKSAAFKIDKHGDGTADFEYAETFDPFDGLPDLITKTMALTARVPGFDGLTVEPLGEFGVRIHGRVPEHFAAEFVVSEFAMWTRLGQLSATDVIQLLAGALGDHVGGIPSIKDLALTMVADTARPSPAAVAPRRRRKRKTPEAA